jgi:hypothetical protein
VSRWLQTEPPVFDNRKRYIYIYLSADLFREGGEAHEISSGISEAKIKRILLDYVLVKLYSCRLNCAYPAHTILNFP